MNHMNISREQSARVTTIETSQNTRRKMRNTLKSVFIDENEEAQFATTATYYIGNTQRLTSDSERKSSRPFRYRVTFLKK